MPKKALARAVLTTLAAAALLGGTTPAIASITYNYAQDWMFDSQSGLYWQVLPIPTATFVPSTGTLAGFEQIAEVGNHVGLPGSGLFTFAPLPAGPYSPELANLLAFFQSGTPAQSAGSQPDLSVAAIYDSSPQFEYTYFNYGRIDPADPENSTWSYLGTSTIGSYGPGFPCPGAAGGGTCPAFAPGLVVSTTEPVPAPAAGWLLLTGFGALAGFRSKRSRHP